MPFDVMIIRKLKTVFYVTTLLLPNNFTISDEANVTLTFLMKCKNFHH